MVYHMLGYFGELDLRFPFLKACESKLWKLATTVMLLLSPCHIMPYSYYTRPDHTIPTIPYHVMLHCTLHCALYGTYTTYANIRYTLHYKLHCTIPRYIIPHHIICYAMHFNTRHNKVYSLSHITNSATDYTTQYLALHCTLHYTLHTTRRTGYYTRPLCFVSPKRQRSQSTVQCSIA